MSSGEDRRQAGRPDDWLFHTLTRIEDQQTRHASEMRLGLQEIRQAQATHQTEDALVHADVRAIQKRLASKSAARQHLHTLLLSTGLVALWEGLKHFMGWT